MTAAVTLVCNPKSGGSDTAIQRELVETLAPLGTVSLHECASKETFDADLRSATADADLVIVAAGDGTMNLTLNALHERLDDLVFALIPMGTGNDHVRTLGLELDPVDAAHQLIDAREIVHDVGVASGPGVERWFLNACMGGFPVEVDEAIGEDLKARLGPASFWVGGIKALADLERWTVHCDGETFEDCLAVGVGNGRTAGGGITVWPQADPSDGRFDLCVMAAGSVMEAMKLAAKTRSGEHLDLPEVAYRQAGSFRIEAEPELEFNLDGELIGLKAPATFERAGSIRLLSPAG